MGARAKLALSLAALLAVHGLASYARARLVPPRAASVAPGPLLASTTRTIGEAAMQLHALTDDDPSIAVEADVAAALDVRTRIRLVFGDAHDVALFRAALRERHVADRRVTFVPASRPITSWSRDRMLVLGPSRRGAPTTLVAPPHAQRGPEARVNDWRIPWLLRDSLGDAARVVTARFDFDGGDVIADERHVFVASPLFGRNPGRAAGTVLHEVRTLAQRPVIRLGNDAHPSPEHHVCMFLTPLGGNRIGVADPDLGLALLGATAYPEAVGPEGGALHPRTVEVGGAPLVVDDREATRATFRTVAATLRARGYDVVPIPVVPSTEPYVWLSYDNALVDVRNGKTHVVMPTYGVPALDHAARAAFELTGAVVHEVRVDRLFRQGGSVRCVIEPLSMI